MLGKNETGILRSYPADRASLRCCLPLFGKAARVTKSASSTLLVPPFSAPLRFIAAPLAPKSEAAAPVSLRDAAITGLGRPPGCRTLPCRFFYDAAGSELFERICDLPEYYPTRTERGIFGAYASEIIAAATEASGEPNDAQRDRLSLVEFGSGSSVKTRLLMDEALARQARLHYTPIDISADFLRDSAQTLLADYGADRLQITAIAGEYEEALSCLPNHPGGASRLFLFLGGNIGNFTPSEAAAFLARIRAQMRSSDTLLIGAALQTGTARMEAAYNDSAGVTAQFNKNLLARLNREAGSDFDLDNWRHHAPYIAEQGRIEMRLVSACDQTVTFAAGNSGAEPRSFDFGEGEYIHTENSHKYTPDGLATIWTRAGFDRAAQWTDAQNWFSVSLLVPTGK